MYDSPFICAISVDEIVREGGDGLNCTKYSCPGNSEHCIVAAAYCQNSGAYFAGCPSQQAYCMNSGQYIP